MAENENQSQEESAAPDEAVVQEASGQGWVPKDKFRGDEKDWVDAGTFVKRGREILPILRKNNENLLRELNHTKASMNELRQATEEFKKFQKESYERKASDLEGQIVALKSARSQAISDGDGTKVTAVDDMIDGLKDDLKAAKDSAKEAAVVTRNTGTVAVDPALQTWLSGNEWFGKDARLTAQTNALGEVLRRENPGLTGKAFLDKLDEVLLEELPQKFSGKEKRTPNYGAESGSGRGRSAGGPAKSYQNLPSEAKAACDRFVKQKIMTKEAYVADYDWSE
jgi:hypothetical protein